MAERAAVDSDTENLTDKSPAPAGGRPTESSSRATRRRLRVSKRQVRDSATYLRTRLADVVWLASALCAVVLAVGALLVALEANSQNHVVQWFTDGAEWLAGPLGTVFEFEKRNGSPDAVKNSLVNWGIAALVFLVVGRLVHRVIRPPS